MTASRKLALGLVLLGIFGGCGSAGDSTAASERGARVSPLPSVRADELPADCGPKEVEALFTRFLRSIDHQSRADILEYVAPSRELNWFSVSRPAGGFIRLESRKGVARYLLDRARSGETWTLRNAQISPVPDPPSTGPYARPPEGPGSDDEIVAAAFELTLRDKGEQSDRRGGKAGINCETQQFYIWNGG